MLLPVVGACPHDLQLVKPYRRGKETCDSRHRSISNNVQTLHLRMFTVNKQLCEYGTL